MFRTVLFFLVFIASSSSAFASCLDQVADFSEKICGQIQTTGSKQLTEANGELKAGISGIVKKVLADAGFDISGKVLQESYEGVLREDLSKELFSLRDCKIKMVEIARSEVCSTHKIIDDPDNPHKKMLIAETTTTNKIDNLLQAYNFAGQNYLYEIRTGVHSSKTSWSNQYQFYKDKISEILDSYVTSIPDNPELCPEAIAVFQMYISNITNAQNVSSQIRLEETKRSINDPGISRIAKMKENFANDNKRFEQDTAIRTYCSKQIPQRPNIDMSPLETE
jgi:hypothetical protein